MKNNKQKKQQKQNKNTNKKQIIVKRKNVGFDDIMDPGEQLSKIASVGYGKVLASYPSVLNFATVYADPFLSTSARLPMLPLLSSKLVRFVASGSSVISNVGVAWVSVFPERMVTTLNSASANTLTGGPTFFSGINGTDFKNFSTNSPYPIGAFQYNDINSLMFRIVACGIRMRYQGTNLNAAGDWYAVQTSPRQSVAAMDESNVAKFPGNKTGKFSTGGWFAYHRHITCPQDFMYINWDTHQANWVDAISGATVLQDNTPYIGIIARGTAGQPYEYEVVVHAELVGPNLDYTGLGNPHTKETEQVVSSFAKVRNRDRTTVDHVTNVPTESKVSKVIDIIKKGVEQEFPLVSNALKLVGTIAFDK